MAHIAQIHLYPQEIIHEMQQALSAAARMKVLVIVDRKMAIRTACLLAQPDDAVLVAGKGHQQYEAIKGASTISVKQKSFNNYSLHKPQQGSKSSIID